MGRLHADANLPWPPIRLGPDLSMRDSQDGYWPHALLNDFMLLMAAHQHSVSGAMMIGDRRYALEQLSRAYSLDAGRLRELALRLLPYFSYEVPAPHRAH